MMISGIFEIVLTLALTVAAAYPIGAYMADVFENRRTFLAPILSPVERALYRLAGVEPDIEQKWHEYAIAMVLFGGVCMLSLYALLRLQGWLPLNPQEFPGVPPDLAFNIAVSFVTNANWQAYGGETTLSHLSQMAGLTANNFLDSAAAIAIAAALIRALSRNESTTVGNFWVDITRATLYLFLPLALVVALAFAALGVPQTLTASVDATTLEGAKQTISIGPVASQEAIKLIGDNGGGFFNANSAHPFENPSAWSNILQNLSQLVLPVGLIFAYGRMVGDLRQGRALLITMAVLFIVALAVFYWSEARGNPILTALGVDPSLGNMEGKDLRFGQGGAALCVQATTGTGTGASNGVLESMMPLSGLAALFNLPLGCISPGGVGTGLYSLLLLVFITAFIGALMIGRTPEYLGKKIATRDMQFALFALLLSPALVLLFVGASATLESRARQPRRLRTAWLERNCLRLRLERRRQRLGFRRAQCEYPLVQCHDRRRDVLRPVRPCDTDSRHRRIIGGEKEGKALSRDHADRRPAVCRIPARRAPGRDAAAILACSCPRPDRRALPFGPGRDILAFCGAGARSANVR
jgi:K+-transporting ATPase ATPase A chain